MVSIIRRLSLPTEFLLVILFCFWSGIFAGISGVAGLILRVTLPVEFNDSRALTMVIQELVGLAVAAWIGYLRGWSILGFGMRPSWKGTGVGIILALAVAMTTSLLGLLTNYFAPATVKFASVPGKLSLLVFILVSIINPVFEETMETGYFVRTLQRHGMWAAVLASAFFRTFLHAYQGINAVLIILPLGIMFGLVYWRWRDLWPLIVAHVLFSLYALFPLVQAS